MVSPRPKPRRKATLSTTKLTVNLSSEVVDVLKALAKREGTTMTEVLKRAIAVEKFLTEEEAKGNQLYLSDADGGNKTRIARF